jgi:xylulokinase
MNSLLGIDISTTGAKAILIDDQGKVLATSTHTYPLSTPKPMWSEQDPDDWWQAIQTSIKEALAEADVTPNAIKGIGLTGQMHGLVLLDSDNNILRPAILWNDQRTSAQCKEMVDKIGLKNLIRITGNPALTGFTAPKILWVRENEPAIYQKIAHILLPKDYVRFKLSGVYAIDCADASGTSLFDITKRGWSEEILMKLEINPKWLPKVFEGTAVTGEVSSDGAEATGLKTGTPIVGGGGDQAAQAVGVGAVTEGIVALTLGTSGVVFAPTSEPFIDPQGRLHAMCHSLPPKPGQGWHLMGVMLSAGGSLRWYRDTFQPGEEYPQLLKPAEDIPAGSEGLLFLPYLTGERAPYPDPFARGGFIGLTIRHTFAHLTRSVLEGVAFGLRDSMTLINEAGVSAIKQVRISGGGAKSLLWRQIMADVMDAELVTVNTTEGACYGAALLAGVGTGFWPSVKDACEATVTTLNATYPEPANIQVYNSYYQDYRTLYPALKDRFKSLSTKSL